MYTAEGSVPGFVDMRRDPLRWCAQVQRKAAGAVTACSAICNIMVQEKLRGIMLQRLCSIGRLLHSNDAAQNLLGFMSPPRRCRCKEPC